ncbi:MAG: AAA family ATPase [Kiritimatiellia bacterium]
MIRRNIQEYIQKAMTDTPVVLLNGARQTGKTTLAHELANEPGTRFHTLDDAATLALAAGDLSGFIRNLNGPVVIDEIQKAPDLFPAQQARRWTRTAGRGCSCSRAPANVMTLPRLKGVARRAHGRSSRSTRFQPVKCPGGARAS